MCLNINAQQDGCGFTSSDPFYEENMTTDNCVGTDGSGVAKWNEGQCVSCGDGGAADCQTYNIPGHPHHNAMDCAGVCLNNFTDGTYGQAVIDSTYADVDGDSWGDPSTGIAHCSADALPDGRSFKKGDARDETGYACNNDISSEIDCDQECKYQDDGSLNTDYGAIEDCAGECGGSAENCPDWADDPGGYEFVATMTAVVTDQDVQLSDSNDILAAFDSDGNVRGTSFALDVSFGPYEGTVVHEISLRSNDEGDNLTFKFYDASEDAVLDISESYTFVINDIVGSMVAPHALSAGAPDLSCPECGSKYGTNVKDTYMVCRKCPGKPKMEIR